MIGSWSLCCGRKPAGSNNSLLQPPGPKKFKFFGIDLLSKAKKFKVLLLAD